MNERRKEREEEKEKERERNEIGGRIDCASKKYKRKCIQTERMRSKIKEARKIEERSE